MNAWPDHFNAAIQHLNKRVITAFQFSPKELLLGFVVNTTHTQTDIVVQEPSQKDMDDHLAYIEQKLLPRWSAP